MEGGGWEARRVGVLYEGGRRHTRQRLIVAVLSLVACRGGRDSAAPGVPDAAPGAALDASREGEPADGGAEPAACRSSAQTQTPRRVRRLSRREYLNIVTDLFGPLPAGVADKLPPEMRVNGFDNQAEFLTV